ncbi:MAG: monovalent cation:proton antiporter-2 (CPA2) family protein [Deltaproteobacteria bacterium]|nr:monovalent cation:proton antiporter-2 (CPA2) family protein [Deltaproteobacteria bacterium]
MSHSFLQEALIYLAAAILFVPVAKRLGMGSVLGYLLAGITIGPFVLGFVGGEGNGVIHFAEFGVVMMLFLIGLELEPAQFWRMRRLILGSGALQLGLTTLLFTGAFMVGGFHWHAALAIGLALSMSSTAIVLQTFREKGLDQTQSGRCAFAVLLFQDMAVIPILAALPLLALDSLQATGEPGTFLAQQPGWIQTLALLGAVALVILGGRFLVVPFLRFIARIHLRELFTASALFIVLAVAYLMELVGLSPALGTFLAGIVLANSEYRHELESDIEPFKGILLGLFFISVGASINVGLILHRPLLMLLLVGVIIGIKCLALLVTGKLTRLTLDQNLLFSLGLSQVGEFAFVLFSFMSQLQILSSEWTDALMGLTALSMTATPLLLLFNDRLILSRFWPRFGVPEKAEKDADEIDFHHPVIIAGFGPFGSTLGRFLRANGVEATILDNDSDRVDLLRRMGFKAFYGDATRIDILQAAGADKAKFLIAAIGSPPINHNVVETAQKHFPHLTFLVRAENPIDAFDFLESGIRDIYRETLDTSVRLGVDVLVRLGHRRYSALRAGQNFIRYDEEAMHKLAPHRHDRSAFISNVREQIQIQEELLANDRAANPSLNDHAWDNQRGVGAPDPK